MIPVRRLALELTIYLGGLLALAATIGAWAGWLVGRRGR